MHQRVRISDEVVILDVLYEFHVSSDTKKLHVTKNIDVTTQIRYRQNERKRKQLHPIKNYALYISRCYISI